MSKQIWLGPILGSNRERLIERCSDMLAAGSPESFLYLAASRPLLELVTDRLLDGKRVRGVWGTLPVFLFRGFVRHLLTTAVEAGNGVPLSPRVAIDREDAPLKRSLLSQLIKRLHNQGRLRAIGPLASREGCVNSVASLIGEIQRAAKSPREFGEIVDSRLRDAAQGQEQLKQDTTDAAPPIPRQVDFDRDVALIYSAYSSALDRFRLTEDDSDALRALQVLRGGDEETPVSIPWLPHLRLLVLDGFFDFTPVQGEMLRLLIPRIPDVVVNLNRDGRNPEIFRPFDQTIGQLNSMAEFETIESLEAAPVIGALESLRGSLFNPAGSARLDLDDEAPTEIADEEIEDRANISLLECSDRSTEIHAAAKEIKRLVLREGYDLSDIALVVRERASYAHIVNRILDEEMIPCALERRLDLAEAPAVRAAAKLLQLLRDRDREEMKPPRAGDLADLIKSEYFRLGPAELSGLAERLTRDHAQLLDGRRARSLAGRWDADELENVIAYVGAELRADTWLARARRLTSALGIDAVYDSAPVEEAEIEADDSDSQLDGEVENEAEQRRGERSAFASPGSEARRRIAREVHPASIAWAALVVEKLAQLINAAPEGGEPIKLRDALMKLLDQLEFSSQITTAPATDEASEEFAAALARQSLDLRGLEGIRRAFNSAIRGIEIAGSLDDPAQARASTPLSAFLDEVSRCIRAQTLAVSGADRDGLRVLEATDVRGLRFRAVFIAGLIEGGFPLRAPGDWIYPHDERERLKQYGLTLEDISPDTLLKEEHYFYQAACRATERLYLSRPLVLEDASETVASYYIDELRHAVAPIELQTEVIRKDFDGQELFSASAPPELAVSLVRQQERHLHRANREQLLPRAAVDRLIDEVIAREYLSGHAVARIEIERERAGPRFGRFDGVVDESNLAAMMREMYGAGHLFSASELSLYGKCPFKFFAQRVLKIEPRGEAALDLSALDAGKLLHEVLRRFFERHRRQRLTSLDREALHDELRAVADEVFDEHERTVPPLNPQIWAIDKEIRKVVLDQVLNYEFDIQQKTEGVDTRPAFFELAFGMNVENADPQSVDELVTTERPASSDGESEQALIRGQIDRVDVAADGTAVAYDYKLSRGAALEDMREGRDLQLHIYLTALEQLFLQSSEIAGGGYYILRGAERGRRRGLYREALSRYTGLGKSSGNLSESDWQEARAVMEQRIWGFIDGMRAARFDVNPSAPEQTCRVCDYAAVCRYEKFRIRRKTTTT